MQRSARKPLMCRAGEVLQKMSSVRPALAMQTSVASGRGRDKPLAAEHCWNGRSSERRVRETQDRCALRGARLWRALQRPIDARPCQWKACRMRCVLAAILRW